MYLVAVFTGEYFVTYGLVIAAIVYFVLGLMWPVLLAAPLIWCTCTFLYRVRIEGAHHVPASGPVLLICNHVTRLDWFFVLFAIRRHIRFVVNSADLRVPVLGWIMRWARVIPIDRTGNQLHEVWAGMKQAQAALAKGRTVCIFPEGRRTRDGRLGSFARGFEHLAQTAQVPIVPIYINGMWGSLWSRSGEWRQRLRQLTWRRRVSVLIGEPMPAHSTRVEVQKAIDQLSHRANASAGLIGA